MSPAQFPTNGDVLNHVRWLCARHGVPPARQKPPPHLFSDAADEICEMWDGEGIPRYDSKYVKTKVRNVYQWGKSVNQMDILKASRDAIEKNAIKAKQLFDLARCQCQVNAWDDCTCARDSKIPRQEWDFVQDQRGPRLMTLGGRDWAISALRDYRMHRRKIRSRQQRAPDGR